jgi:hypothetical protein
MNVIPDNFAANHAGPACGGLLLAAVGGDLRRLYDGAPAPLPDEIAALVARLGEQAVQELVPG